MSAQSIKVAPRCFCYADEGPLTAARLMNEQQLKSVMVLDRNGTVVGIYTRKARGLTFSRAVLAHSHAWN